MTSVHGLPLLELVQRTLSPAYGLRCLVSTRHADGVYTAVVGWPSLSGCLLPDVTRRRSRRIRHWFSSPSVALIAGALLGRVGQVVVVGDRPVRILG